MPGKKKAMSEEPTSADARKNPITVRLPPDIREALDGLLKKHPLIKQAMFLQFAVAMAIEAIEREPSLIEEFARRRQTAEK
jgi:hypothetical protein